MPYFGDNVRLGNGKKIQGRNAANTNWVDLAKINANNEIEMGHEPRVTKRDFTRMGRPLAGSLLDGGAAVFGAPTGAAGDENVLIWGKCTLEYHMLGTQTILAPSMTATGLDVTGDDTENDGLEICPGILASNGDHVYTVGTDGAFWMEYKITVSDVSDFDELVAGFRKLEAYQANVDDYDEMAALNVVSGDIKIATILNAAATTTTDTTDNWADTEQHTLRIDVSDAGVVTYKIDGVAPTTTAAFTFDTGEVVVPFARHLKAASPQAGTIIVQELNDGLL